MADISSELAKAKTRAQPTLKQLDQLDLLIGRLEDMKSRLEKGQPLLKVEQHRD